MVRFNDWLLREMEKALICRVCQFPCHKYYSHGHIGAFPGGSSGKESACQAEDAGSVPGSRRSPGEGNGKLLQYSCLENPMDRGACRLQSMGSQGSDII